MSNMVDLTKRLDGKLNSISLQTATMRNSPGVPLFLKQASLGQGLRACYFKDGAENIEDCYYDLAWLKIPEGFTYLEYQAIFDSNHKLQEVRILNNETPNIDNEDDPNRTNNDLLTPLLLLYQTDSAPPPANFNYCVGRPGSSEACAAQVSAIRDSPLQLRMSKRLTSTINHPYPFYLFRFTGYLRTLPTQGGGNDENGVYHEGVKGVYYLTPLILSDRLVVYHVFTDNDPEVLKAHYEAAANNKYAEIELPLVHNDEKGIFVTTELTWRS